MWGAAGLAKYGFDRYYHGAYPMKYTELIDAACEEKGLDRALVYAVVRTESGFDPRARSNVGAQGLMQLMPDAFDWVQMRKGGGEAPKGEDCFDPATNIEYGTSMLRILLDEFGTVENVLCAYHAGWGSASSGGRPRPRARRRAHHRHPLRRHPRLCGEGEKDDGGLPETL